MATASEERPPNLPSASEERQPNLPSASEERPPNLLSASEEKLPSDCDCQNLFLKLKRKPADEGAQKCCKHSKCTVAQLMKLCQMDPDCIMDLFKIAKWDEKCLPDVEMDQEGANRNEDAKYHFLMVDNSTQGSESTSEKIVEERINEVKSIFQHSIVASTATDTDRNRFNKILWPVSVEDTPEICSVRLEESSLKTNETQPEKPKAEEKMPPAQDQEQVPKEVMNSQTRGPQDPGEPPRKTVQKHIEKMNVWMQTQKPVPAETDSLTMEIFKRRNSPDLSETQTPSILRNMEGSKEEDSFSNSKATVRRRKSIIKTQSITEGISDPYRVKSIIWSDFVLVRDKEIAFGLHSDSSLTPFVPDVTDIASTANDTSSDDSRGVTAVRTKRRKKKVFSATPTSERSLSEESIRAAEEEKRRPAPLRQTAPGAEPSRCGRAFWRRLCAALPSFRRKPRDWSAGRRSTIQPELLMTISKRASRTEFDG